MDLLGTLKLSHWNWLGDPLDPGKIKVDEKEKRNIRKWNFLKILKQTNKQTNQSDRMKTDRVQVKDFSDCFKMLT